MSWGRRLSRARRNLTDNAVTRRQGVSRRSLMPGRSITKELSGARHRAGGTGARRCPGHPPQHCRNLQGQRSEEHTSELQSLMRISYAVFCLKKKKKKTKTHDTIKK